MLSKLRYLLLQVRNPDDLMRFAEIMSFARGLQTDASQITVFDLLNGVPSQRQLDATDVILLGGSGHYSALGEEDWLLRALDALRGIHDTGKPTFASCWGFQAFARAMGGTVVYDPQRAEVGSLRLQLSPAGREDPIFAPLGDVFHGQMGHEYCVSELPPGATLLASSEKVENQAYRLDGQPIYCTQFHPELNCADLWERVRVYPDYIERIAGLPIDRFGELLQDTPKAEALLWRFVKHVFAE